MEQEVRVRREEGFKEFRLHQLEKYLKWVQQEPGAPTPVESYATQFLSDLKELGLVSNLTIQRGDEKGLEAPVIAHESSGISLNRATREVRRPDGGTSYLTPTEADILFLLMQWSDRIVTYNLFLKVLQYDGVGIEQYLRVYMAEIRPKIGDKRLTHPGIKNNWTYIRVVTGVGYMFGSHKDTELDTAQLPATQTKVPDVLFSYRKVLEGIETGAGVRVNLQPGHTKSLTRKFLRYAAQELGIKIEFLRTYQDGVLHLRRSA